MIDANLISKIIQDINELIPLKNSKNEIEILKLWNIREKKKNKSL